MGLLPPKWTNLRYHEDQCKLWQAKRKIQVVVAGRGSGKTELARRKLICSAPIKKPWPDPIYAYCLPTFAQAKRVAWRPMLSLIPPSWIKKPNGINIADQSIELVTGAIIYVMGMDQPQRIEGIQLDGVIIDECSDHKPGTFTRSILPTLNWRDPFCWRIGVPKKAGIGRIEFRAAYEQGVLGDPNIDSFMWRSSTVLSEEQLEAQKSIMTEEEFDEQYNAVWLDAGGSVYHAFSSDNIRDDAVYHKDLSIIVGADFNVDPMCWVLGHEIDDQIHVFDEIFLRNTNTEATLRHLATKYGHHRGGFKFYCDASSKARSTKAPTGKTDYLIIKNFTDLHDSMVFYPKKNPFRKDRFATVNALMCNALGVRNLLINSKCKRLINDFRMMAYREGTTDPENYDGTDIGHMSDGCGYMVFRVKPMKVLEQDVPVVLST